jgi:hypothetical protein
MCVCGGGGAGAFCTTAVVAAVVRKRRKAGHGRAKWCWWGVCVEGAQKHVCLADTAVVRPSGR